MADPAPMETRRLTAAQAGEAAELLRSGALVAFPTETVYGLGANGLDSAAVARIFAAKGRPQDNPLILHIPSADHLARYCRDIPPAAYTLTDRFWPGPLTLILPRARLVPDAVTAGLDTVGMRCPDHPVAQAILELCQLPIAAPSANTSGRPSPTTAEATLEDMGGRIAAVVDGGPCAVGVESTILDLTTVPPTLLRPGGVTLEQLREVLGQVAVDPAVNRIMSTDEAPRAPGMKYRHYAPKAPVTVIQGDFAATAAYIADHLTPTSGVICFEDYVNLFPGHPLLRSLGPVSDPDLQARRLFSALRSFDATEVTEIFAQSPDPSGLGLAITNRLNKAAGFHIIHIPNREVERIMLTAGRTFAQSQDLLYQYNAEPFHRRHGQTVAAVMGWFAEALGHGEEKEFWTLVGLMHDVDFEKWPEEHCIKAKELLAQAGYTPQFIHAVACHAYGMPGVEDRPELEMEKVLFACDELTGLIGAAALMRPSKSCKDMELKSLKKKYKDKKFAAGCSREVIAQGAEGLGWELDKLLDMTLQAMAATEDAVEAALA